MFDKEVYFAEADDRDITLIPFVNRVVIDEVQSTVRLHKDRFNIGNYHYGLNFCGRLGKHTAKLSYELAVGDLYRTDTTNQLLKAIGKTMSLFTSTKAEIDKLIIDVQMGEKPRTYYRGIVPDLSMVVEFDHPTAINQTPFITAHLKSYTKLTKNYQNTLITVKAQKIDNILTAIEDNVLASICSEFKLTS